MKKTTVGLVGALFILMLSSSAWAHSGLQINLGGGGFGFSISDGHSGFSTYTHSPYQPYPNNYSGYISTRPYLGWGGYKGQHHHNHNQKRWGHHRSEHRNKGHRNSHQRSYKRGHHNQHNGSHQHQGHQRRHGRR